jgi:guanylate kinase
MRRGELFILSAPSGAGKTTLIHRLMESGVADSGDLQFSVSHTTREPRQGEVDGIDYHFIDPPTFRSMLTRDEFLEWAQVHGNYYGTSRTEVLPRLEQGVDVLLDVDVQGAERVMATHPGATGIFILPPSYKILRERLESRGRDDPEEIARRLAVSLWEIRRYRSYHYVVINDDLDHAVQALRHVLYARRQDRDRMEPRVAPILADFERAVDELPAGVIPPR